MLNAVESKWNHCMFVGVIPNSSEDLIFCPYCNTWSSESGWKEKEGLVHCDLCGDHNGMQCPSCEYINDVTRSTFKVIRKENHA